MDGRMPSAATLHAASGAPGLFYGATRSRNSRARALRCDAFLARESAGPLREPSLSLPVPTELYVTSAGSRRTHGTSGLAQKQTS